MSRATILPRNLFLLLVLPVVAVGCKRCGPRPDTDGVVDVDTDVVSVDTVLQVVSIDPNVVQEGTPTEASVYGSGFQEGASVTAGDLPATGISFLDENTLTLTLPSLGAGTYDVVVANPDAERSTLRQGLVVRGASEATCQEATVHFGFDESSLDAEARGELDELVPCYQQADFTVRLEGHADERGTTDYNLALGQRRADAVARYLSGQGISERRLQTVSYGEERPVATGHDEAAWAENRRVELHAND